MVLLIVVLLPHWSNCEKCLKFWPSALMGLIFFFRRINALFILVDAATALILGKLGKVLARVLLKDQADNAKSYHQVTVC